MLPSSCAVQGQDLKFVGIGRFVGRGELKMPSSAILATPLEGLGFVSLEITGRCQLGCLHCYADSGPQGTHGTMVTSDWLSTIDQCAAMGVRRVQFIGGEPTLHPDLPGLVGHSLEGGLEVEVYTNLVRVTAALWGLFQRPGVQLGTSYYSPDPAEHDAITGRRGSHDRTLANIREAVGREIPLRVGVIQAREDQRVEAARAELRALGVRKVEFDLVRQVGRGVRDRCYDIDQLCGHCGDRKVTVSPSGEVWPCVMARWLTLGNVHQAPLADVYEGSRGARAALQQALRELPPSRLRAKDKDDDDDGKGGGDGDGGCEAPVCCIPPHLK
jgi:MoaA/NifB/PqqE/SkfB family radical SAM enzyme